MWWFDDDLPTASSQMASGIRCPMRPVDHQPAARQLRELRGRLVLYEAAAQQYVEEIESLRSRQSEVIDKARQAAGRQIAEANLAHEGDIANLIAIIASIEETAAERSVEFNRMRSRLAQCESDLEEKTKRLQQIQQQTQQDAQRHNNELEQAHDASRGRDVIIRRLRSQLGRQNNDHDKKLTLIQNAHEQTIKETHRQHAAEVCLLRQALLVSRQEADEHATASSDLKKELLKQSQDHAGQLADLRVQHTTETRRYETALEVSEQKAAERDGLKQQLIASEIQIGQLQTELDTAQGDSTNRAVQIRHLESNLAKQADDHRRDCQELQRRADERFASVQEGCSEETNRMVAEKQSLERSLQASQQQQAALHSTVEQLKRKCDAQVQQITRLTHDRVTSDACRAKREQSYETAATELRGEIDRRDQMIHGLQVALQTASLKANEHRAEHHDDQQQVRQAVEAVEQRMEQLEAEAENKFSLLATTRRENEELSNQSARLAQQHAQEIASLHRSLRDANDRCKQLEEDSRQLSADSQKRQSLLADAEQRSGQLLSMQNKLRHTLQQRLHTEIDLRQSAETKLRQVREDNTAVRTELDRVRAGIQKLVEQNDLLRESFQAANRCAQSSEHTVASLERNTDALRERLRQEATARRKAQSALRKQAVGDPRAMVQETWIELATDEQIQRLTRRLKAVEKMRTIERRRAVDQIHRHRNQINDLQNRRAA